MNLTTLSRSPRAMKALTGLSYEEFINLVPLFKAAYIAMKLDNPKRARVVWCGILTGDVTSICVEKFDDLE